MTYKAVVSLLLMTFMIYGCNKPVTEISADPEVINVEDDDAEMNAAINTARETFGFFEKNWQTMENDGASLKFALPTYDGEVEHIWFSPTSIENNKVTGECANDPVKISGLQFGDVRTVSREDVSDWMIVVGDKCYGGYTIRVLTERNPDAAPPLEFIDPPANSNP